MDDTFGIATGWLGWTPEVALETPIPQIVLAYRGLMKKTANLSPFHQEAVPTKRKDTNDVIGKAKAFASFFGSKGK